MPGDRRQILSLLRLPIPPLQRNQQYQSSTCHDFAQLGNFAFSWYTAGADGSGRTRVDVERCSADRSSWLRASCSWPLDWGWEWAHVLAEEG